MTSPSFLYIENHVASRKVMRLLLVDMLDYSDLTLWENTEQVIEKLEQLETPFDIIFLDLDLEPLNGYEVCRQLREHASYQQTSIVAVTATTKPGDLRQMENVGFNGALSKPLNLNAFPDQLQRILAGDELWDMR